MQRIYLGVAFLGVATVALTVLTGCWEPSTKWNEAKQRASCESAFPGEPDKAKDCYNTAKVFFDRETAKTTEGQNGNGSR